MTFIQRCIDVKATLYERHVSAGIWISENSLSNTPNSFPTDRFKAVPLLRLIFVRLRFDMWHPYLFLISPFFGA